MIAWVHRCFANTRFAANPRVRQFHHWFMRTFTRSKFCPYRGTRIWCDRHDMDGGLVARLGKTYEPETLAIIEGLEPGMTFVDVGANIGIFSKVAASRGVRVIAIEPNPLTFSHLARTFEDTPAVLLSRAVSAWRESRPLFDNPVYPGLTNFYAGTNGFQVDCAPLDDLLFGEPRIHLIKIDVEGAELEVLSGARLTLAWHRPRLIVEAVPERLALTGHTIDSLRVWLLTHRYSYERIDDRNYYCWPCST